MKKSALFIIITMVLYPGLVSDLSAQTSDEHIYVGEKVCRQCHNLPGSRDQYNPWRLSKHARAYSSLFKPEAKEIAELSGIDIEPQKSPICLGCHTTAYNVEEWEREETFHFEDGVQCELCHGPGSEYSDPETMRDSNKAAAAGLIYPQKRRCLICHKEKNSHVTVLHSEKFDYDVFLARIKHPDKGGAGEKEMMTVPGQSGKQTYAGAYACAACHNDPDKGRIFSKWYLSRHATAYADLSSEEAGVIAREMKVDEPPQRSEKCLKCHATGTAGGMNGADPALGVQCESCHGTAHKHIMDAMGIPSGSVAGTGWHEVSEKTCATCHISGIHGSSFNYIEMKQKIDHSKWAEKKVEIRYKTPFNLAVSRDGRRLYVACEASNSVIIVDLSNDRIIREIGVGMQPHFVCLSPDGSRAYVSNRASDNVSVIDTHTYKVLSTIAVGDEPHEIAITKDGSTMYVVNAGTWDVSVVDLGTNTEIKRLAASRGPWGAAISPDGSDIFVSNNLPRFGEFRTAPLSEVTMIDTKTATVKKRIQLSGANLIQGIAVSPDNEFVLVTLVRSKNLVPMTRNIQGWIMTNGIGIIWKDGRVDQLLLDAYNDFFADPTDVVFSVDGKYAFVTGGGVQEVAVIDVQAMKSFLTATSDSERIKKLPDYLGSSVQFVARRIKVGQSPRGMVVSPDNKYLYVAIGLDDAVAVIDINSGTRTRTISLGGPTEITKARYGERIFHSAEYTFNRQFSCHSCHPDGSVDGLAYDIEPDGLGLNPVDNRTLRGINDTAPFKWTGKNPTLKRQCGPRLAAFFTRSDPFEPEQSEALDRYIVTIPRSPNRYVASGELNDAQRRGRRIFERTRDNSGNLIPEMKRCSSCHTFPYYTDRELADVGTTSELDTHGIFDVPHLNNIYETSPYLHDGRASSLEEIWTLYNKEDKHGVTNDLTKDQLNDLIEYLKTL